jgi:surface antigen
MYVLKQKILAGSVAVIFASGLSGCAMDQMSKEDIGTGIGVLAGAVLGSKMGNGGAGAVALGALAGGFLGHAIGAHLDEEDRKDLAAKTAQNLETMQAGQKIDWQSAKTGNSATVTVSNVTEEKRQVNIQTASAITVPADVKLLSKTYQATKATTIYTQSNATTGNIVGTLAKNKTAKVMGMTNDGQWLLVARKGTLVGFIKSEDAKIYVQPKPVAVVAKAEPKSEPQHEVADLDNMSAKEVKGQAKTVAFDLDSVQPVTKQATATTECKTLIYDINTKGQTSKETAKACKVGGAWELG